MGTLAKLKDNSKPIIWFVIIAFIMGFCAVLLFRFIADSKLSFFGIADSDSYSMVIGEQPIQHLDTTANQKDPFDYISTFLGFKAATTLDISNLDQKDIYDRHVLTKNILKKKVATDLLYNNLFDNDISDIDILMFISNELMNFNPSIDSPSYIYQRSSIHKIAGSLSRTWFKTSEGEALHEPLVDLPNGVYDEGDKYEDANANGRFDLGEILIEDIYGNGIWDQRDGTFTDIGNGIWDEGEAENEELWTIENDLGNGAADEAEEYIDSNNNKKWDEDEELTDLNGNGKWDDAEYRDSSYGGNGKWDEGELLIDLNENSQWDEGEQFFDKGNGKYDPPEDFTDTKNEQYDRGEDFTDCGLNEEKKRICEGEEGWKSEFGNGKWDEDEKFTDKENGVWDNGLNKWLEKCLNDGKIHYEYIFPVQARNNIKDHITMVASYDVKTKKYAQVFKNISKDKSRRLIEQDYLALNSKASISFVSYDLNNIKTEDINQKIDDEKIVSETVDFEKVELGSFSSVFLLLLLLLFVIFSILNRKSRPKLSLGIVFSSLLCIVVIFRFISDSKQGDANYKEIAYIYIEVSNNEGDFFDPKRHDKGDGKWNPDKDIDCGLDNDCDTVDKDGSQGNGERPQEKLTKDLNNNGKWEEGDSFRDCGLDRLCPEDEGYKVSDFGEGNEEWDKEDYLDKGNGIWNEGEEWDDCIFNDERVRICEGDQNWKDEFGNGKYDTKESIALEELDNIKNSITTSKFETVYSDSSITNKKDEIVLSKQFSQDNLDNLGPIEQRLFQSMLIDLINQTFKTEKGNIFVINHKQQDNLIGYFIGYVSDEGNYHNKKQHKAIKERYAKKAKETIVLEKGVFDFDRDTFREESNNAGLGNEELNIVVDKYKENNLNFGEHQDESFSRTATLMNSQNNGEILGTLLQMEPGDISDIIFTDTKAYLIYMRERTIADLSSEDFKKYHEEQIATQFATFKDIFEDAKESLTILDWTSQSSFLPPSNTSIDQPDNSGIADIYFNLDNFSATLSRLYNTEINIQ